MAGQAKNITFSTATEVGAWAEIGKNISEAIEFFKSSDNLVLCHQIPKKTYEKLHTSNLSCRLAIEKKKKKAI